MAGPMPAKFIFPSLRCSVPPRFIIDIIFCIQFSPVMCTSLRTSGNSPQKVKKIVISSPMAAPVVPRMNVGHTLSRSPDQAMITSLSCGTCSGCAGAAAGSAAASSVASTVLMTSASSALPDDESVHAGVLGLLDELVPGRRAPGVEVGHGTGVGGK